jgi:hypothetical protein
MNGLKHVRTGLAGAAALLIVGLAAGGGCASGHGEKPQAERHQREEMPVNTDEDARAFDAAIVQAHQNEFETAGVIRQHTIFPYHFVADSATLNELGLRDVSILAQHYASLPADQGLPPSTLSVRRGDAAPGLYEARVRAVTAELARGGVPNDRVRIADATPGGDGMLPGKIKVILQRDTENKPYYEIHESSSGGTNTGGSESGTSTSSGSSSSGGTQ